MLHHLVQLDLCPQLHMSVCVRTHKDEWSRPAHLCLVLLRLDIWLIHYFDRFPPFLVILHLPYSREAALLASAEAASVMHEKLLRRRPRTCCSKSIATYPMVTTTRLDKKVIARTSPKKPTLVKLAPDASSWMTLGGEGGTTFSGFAFAA